MNLPGGQNINRVFLECLPCLPCSWELGCSVGSCTHSGWGLACLKSVSPAPVMFPGVLQARSTGQSKQGCSSQALSSPRETLVISAFLWGSQLGQGFLDPQHMVPGSVVPLPHCPRVRELALPTAELRECPEKGDLNRNILQTSSCRQKNSRNTTEPMDSVRMTHSGQIGSQNPLNILSFPGCMHSIYLVVGAGVQ